MNAPFPASSRTPGLPMWVIYDRPSDHPDGLIARFWLGTSPQIDTIARASVPELREVIRQRMPHAVCLSRFPEDDPKIVEVWF